MQVPLLEEHNVHAHMRLGLVSHLSHCSHLLHQNTSGDQAPWRTTGLLLSALWAVSDGEVTPEIVPKALEILPSSAHCLEPTWIAALQPLEWDRCGSVRGLQSWTIKMLRARNISREDRLRELGLLSLEMRSPKAALPILKGGL